MEDNGMDKGLELGTWIGRKQAFGLVAGRCSAADAKCLREIRENKQYRETGLSWEEFCSKYLGMSRAQADKTIRQLDEFGEAFFHLAGFSRITEQNYRLIAGAVNEKGVEYQGTRIAIAAENSVRLAAAVKGLLLAAKPGVPAPDQAAVSAVPKAENLMRDALAELRRLTAARLGDAERKRVRQLIARSREHLEQMAPSREG
jgi:hypothetical protein